ncbi:MAG: PQQ-dependent sugar dehydrogenase [Anaerolineales bacterium]|nr:PQQ-dependent sugar dehydrogenase [Anaerolineales bacterium]
MQPNLQIDQFELLTPSSGWVLSNEHLFWTLDAAQTWNEIGPAIPLNAKIQDVYFLDQESGWILWNINNPDGGSSFTLARTLNHGQNWETLPLDLFDEGDVSAHSEKASIGWFDVQAGWIAVKQATSSNFSLGTLFTTSDGGVTWVRSTLPVADNISFSESQTGWATGGPAGDQIFRTQDGGVNWLDAKSGIKTDALTVIYQPYYFNGQGILVTTDVGLKNNLTLYVYDNSIDEWSLVYQVALGAEPGIIPLSILDPENFLAVISGTKTIVRMKDGEFDTFENTDGLSSSIVNLDMVSTDIGWAKSVEADCVTASSLTDQPASVSCSSTTRLLQTFNGGVTWQTVHLPDVRPEITALEILDIENANITSTLAGIGSTNTFTGQGFDKCEIPSISQMQTWWNNSPYKAVNLYIGGSSRACANNVLTAYYLQQLNQQGWQFIPTWVGPQAPCTGFSSRMSSNMTTAYNQGVSEANLAVERLAELGLTYPDKTGSVVYYDIEYYGTDSACRNAVNAFMNGWVSQIKSRGNLAGVYGSTLCNTGLSDFLNITNIPDVIWPARWYHNIGEGYYDPSASVWNLGTCIPNTVWANQQRIRQYEGDHDETWGSLTLGIDSNVLDGVVAVPAFLDPSKLTFQEVASGLNNPVFITHAGDGSNRLFVLERSGKIRIIKNGSLLSTPFLDIQSSVRSTSGEQGLLGLAFHPSYASNGKFYVVYTAPRSGDSNGSVLTLRQYTVSVGNPDLANTGSGATILTIDHPTNSNHNGGTIAFGNDGYLYWSTGDGGGGGDPNNNAQNLKSHLGKILRIDVNSGSPYAIPATNPFYSDPTSGIKKEIWAYGLRNPWRISFDRSTHDLYIGDVGQGVREEIDFQPSNSTGGQNYGWRIMEGSLCYNPSSGCDQTGKILPVAEYDHTLGCSVTGGYVYRGSNFPSLKGYYLYGDFCSGRIFSTYNNLPTGWTTPVQLADTAFNITTFGEDQQGELYLADYATGKIYKIKYADPSISGNVGVGGVTLSYTDGVAKSVTSKGDGSYTITVPSGWSGTVTPTSTCHTFAPQNLSYSNLGANTSGQNYTSTFNTSIGCSNINVTIGGNTQGNYGIGTGQRLTDRYGINGGPVRVRSTNGMAMFTSQRAIYGSSFNSIVGFPADQLTTEYWFTSLDDAGMITYLVIGNPSETETALVDVYIGGEKKNTTPYSIPPGQRVYPRYGINGGPVRVVSTNGVNIFTSERSKYGNSFNEVMGFPSTQLDTEFWFTSYDDAGMITYLVIGNPSETETAEVDVYIGGVKKNTTPYSILPGQRVFPRYGINGGPVRVVSTNGVKVFTSERTKYGNSFNEVLGYPIAQTSTELWFTSLDDASMITYLVIGNPSETETAEVDVYIGGVKKNTTPYSILPGQRVFPRYGINGGPVRVVSTNGVKVFTSERTKYLSSFNEILGIPTEGLTTDYWYTSLDDVGMTTELVIAAP